MKILVYTLRALIVAYIILVAACYAILYVKTNVYDETYPTILGYNYMIYDTDRLEPDIKEDSLIIINDDNDYINEGEFIVYRENTNLLVKKVEKVDNYLLTISYKNGEEQQIIDSKQVLGKVASKNNFLCTFLQIIINPIALVILASVGLIFPELLFNK